MTSTLSSYSPTLTSNTNSSTLIKNEDSDKFHVVAGSTPFFKVKDKSKVYKEATKQEIDFYEKLFKNTRSPPNNKLIPLVPKFSGLSTQKNKEYIILEDLTFGYKKPCIMDIKLGLSHHDVNLDHLLFTDSNISTNNNSNTSNNILGYENIKNQIISCVTKDNNKYYKSWLTSKYITTPTMGFCVCGSQKYNKEKREYEKSNKEQGRTLTQDTVVTQLYEFFHNGKEFKKDVVLQFYHKLKLFKDYFESNPDFKFRSTSILFIYEGDNSSTLPTDSNNTVGDSIKFDIRLIDFTHTKEYPEWLKPHVSILSTKHENELFFPVDGGYLYGITTLLNLLDTLKEEK